MPNPRVGVPYDHFIHRCARHRILAAGLPDIADHQVRKLLAELVMMRLFDDLQELIQGVAVRLACGAPYLDGVAPVLRVAPFRSTTQALHAFENLNRNSRKFAKWSKPAFVGDSIKHVLGPNEYLYGACVAASAQLEEMRVVRNKIAHAAVSDFRDVVRRYYGAHLNNVTPGHLLLSPRRSPNLLTTYIQTCEVIARSICRA